MWTQMCSVSALPQNKVVIYLSLLSTYLQQHFVFSVPFNLFLLVSTFTFRNLSEYSVIIIDKAMGL